MECEREINNFKEKIFIYLFQSEAMEIKTEVLCWIKEYETKYPFDLDLYLMKAWCAYKEDNVTEAEDYLQSGLKINCFYLYFNYYLAIIFQHHGNFVQALKYYCFSYFLANPNWQQHLQEKIIEVKIHIKRNIGNEIINNINEQFTYCSKAFPLNEQSETCIMKELSYFHKKYFIGLYDHYAGYMDGDYMVAENFQTLQKAEIFQVHTEKEYTINGDGSKFLIPILNSEFDNPFMIFHNNDHFQVDRGIMYRYLYYNLEAGDKIVAAKPLQIGNPIPLKMKENKRKLVLAIFVDGLAQTILEQEGLAEIMPQTYRYFSQGCICTNAYAVAEWTLPSVANIVTGLYTTNHSLYHPNYDQHLPEKNKILYELFQEEGYVTSKIDGNWRTTPTYGYLRGVDRTLYHSAIRGMNVSEVIGELIESIETFQETNHFLWSCNFDLHSVGDGFEGDMLVQKNLCLQDRDISRRKKEKSVKLHYDRNKIEIYKRQVKRLDIYLGMLFRYLEEKFTNEEIVVTLFSDHGQSYLHQNEHKVMSDERVKIPFMIRGKDVVSGICEEWIESIDILPTLSKLSGIDATLETIDGQLPLYFGGKKARKHTYTESIFPGDTYKASIRTDQFTCFYETLELVKQDGRVRMEQYTMKIIDRLTTEEINDSELKEQCLQIIQEHMKNNRIYGNIEAMLDLAGAYY